MRPRALYILQIWQDSDKEQAWRAKLEDVDSQATLAFGSIDELARFLRRNQGRPANRAGEESPSNEPAGRRPESAGRKRS